MLPGTRAMMLRQYVGYTAMARESPVTSIALWLISPSKRRSTTVRFPSRACQVGHLQAQKRHIYVGFHPSSTKGQDVGIRVGFSITESRQFLPSCSNSNNCLRGD